MSKSKNKSKSKAKKVSIMEKVERHLNTGKTLTTLEACRKPFCTHRLGAVIHQLKWRLIRRESPRAIVMERVRRVNAMGRRVSIAKYSLKYSLR